MVKITLDLIRKRAEHNEGEISTLEEIALHQENIEKIDLLNRTCPNLKILLMQNNLIARIENLNMLKRLEYLNLALNNIEVIENLEGLESLKKLDLTINFIGDLKQVKRLRRNNNLEILYLTGNPCTDYPGYREYVVATLDQLLELDMTKIERSERILAMQNYSSNSDSVVEAFKNYNRIRELQKSDYREKESLKIIELEESNEESETEVSKFWQEKSLHTPEERIAIAKKVEKKKEKRLEKSCKEESEKPMIKLFDSEGKPYNINQAKIRFLLDDESDGKNIVLQVPVYRYLDTRYLEVDVRPNYVRITIKGKVLQLRLSCEVCVTGSSVKRNTTTGNLLITMPRLDPLPEIFFKTGNRPEEGNYSGRVLRRETISGLPKRQLLEIGPADDLDFSKIYRQNKSTPPEVIRRKEKTVSKDFVDDPGVPPLE